MVGSVSSAAVPHPWGSSPISISPSRSFHLSHLIATDAALRFTRFLTHHSHLPLLLHSSLKNLAPIDHVFQLKELWHEKALQFEGLNFLQLSYDVCSATCSSCLYFFSGNENTNNNRGKEKSYSGPSRKDPSNGRRLTNILIAVNVLVYIAQIATKGRLISWGAKVNSLIDQGQLWRLVTSSFLHANIAHLMVNCFSLNSVGPAVENVSGPRRYIALYFTSAVGGSAMSYWLSKSPSVGASGAIFGLTGSFAVFMLRHGSLVKGGMEELQHIARVILLNMVIGGLSRGIDNWGHLGGLIAGVATSWFIGPAWKYEALSGDGRRVFIDRAPILSLIKPKRTPEIA
ncbi:hypothetical protein LguiB_021868 [Lonicera macranthoides]